MDSSTFTDRQLLEQILHHIQAISKGTPRGPILRSPELKELFSALAKAQGSFDIARQTRENAWHLRPYEDITEVVKASRKQLAEQGLAVLFEISLNTEGQSILNTILSHDSGQFITSQTRINPAASDPQSVASFIAFAKRQAYAAIVGVVAEGEDDDAEETMREERERFRKGTDLEYQAPAKPKKTFETITKEQHDELQYELKDYPKLAEEVLHRLKISCLADMAKDQYAQNIRRIRDIKRHQEGLRP